jgi:hypothetical protein
MSEGPAPAYGDPFDDGFWDEDDPKCDGCCEDEFCGANCDRDASHEGSHYCDYHEWVALGCPEAKGSPSPNP